MFEVKIKRQIYLLLVLVCCLNISGLVYAKELQHFDIWEYQVEGNTLLESSDIESALYPYLGSNKTLDVVEKAREVLQSSYKIRGYPIVIVSIPQQNVIGGKVKLKVVEGKIDRLRISGNKYFSRRELRKELPSLEPGQPLNMQQARKEIDIANDANPYRSLVPVIRPGRKPGTMEMELKVKDELPLSASLEINNRYTTDTSPLRIMGSLEYGHLWQKHHSFSLGYQMSPEKTDEVSVFNMSYAMPLNESSRLVLYVVDSASEVATVAGGGDSLTVLGNGKIYGLRSIYTLPADGDYFHRMMLGLAYKDFTEEQNISNEDGSSGFDVPIDYTAWSISYNGTIRKEYITQFSVAANFGVRAFNEPEDFEFKRHLAKANYFYVNANFSQLHNLSNNIKLSYELGGQYTGSPLISNEQFSAGGMDSVRGYSESLIQGDNAITTNLELTYKLLNLKDSFYDYIGLNLFIDAANIYTIDALPDPNGDVFSRKKMLGAGIGINMTVLKNMDFQLYYAKPLKDPGNNVFDDNARTHFSLRYLFR